MKKMDNIEWKLKEAEFFLRKLRTDAFDPMSAQCLLSAFISSARSITFCLQYNLSTLQGFSSWYKVWQNRLKLDIDAKLFHGLRNQIIHEGQIL